MIIIGAGIAGLYMAYKYHSKYPNEKIILLEKSDRLGGRVLSYHKNNIKYEIGAGRFADHHKYIIKLIKEFNLHDKIYPIKNDKDYINKTNKTLIKNQFNTLLEKINKLIKHKKDYNKKTIKELLVTKIEKELLKQLINHYEYYSEIEHYSAEYAYYVNNTQFNNSQFYVLGGGLEQLVKQLEKKIKPYTKIIKKQNVTEIKFDNGIFHITTNKKYETPKLLLAIPNNGIKNIKFSSNIKMTHITKHIATEPLFRIYAKYSINKTTGKVWFQDTGKIVTNSPIKYIIPINRQQGTIMISYTDGKYASDMIKRSKKMDLEKYINNEIQKLFGDIPDAIWMRFYYWDIGCHYWKKLGTKDVQHITKKILQPYNDKKMFVVGETYSKQQAWIEGALESVEECIKMC